MTLESGALHVHAALRRFAFSDEPTVWAAVTHKEKAFTNSPAYAMAIDVINAMSPSELNAVIDEVRPS